MTYSYNPDDAEGEGPKGPWPEGEYGARLVRVEDTTSKTSGNQMRVCYFEVYGPADPRQLREYFVEGNRVATYRYKELAIALGCEAEFKRSVFDAARYINTPLRVRLGIEDGREGGRFNRIKGFVAPGKAAPSDVVVPGTRGEAPAPEPTGGGADDDLPF